MTEQLHLIDAPAWGLQARALLADNRTQSWRFELLDVRNRPLRELGGISGFTMTANVHATIRSGGSCTYRGGGQIDWMRHRIRAHLRVSGRGRAVEWAVGTFLVEAPKTEHSDAAVPTRSLQLFDMMAVLQQATITSTRLVIQAGAPVVPAVRSLLDAAGVEHAIEDSTAVLGAAMAWPAGTTTLRAVNDLLEVANFFACWADGMGVIRSGPYRAPQYRGVSLALRDDGAPGSIPFLPAFTQTVDSYGVPNEVVLVGQSSDPQVPPMVGRALDATGTPFSVDVRGRRITVVEENVPPSATQALMDARAARRLEVLQRVSETDEVQHPMVPVALSDVAVLARTARGVDLTAVIEKTTLSQDAGALATTTLRRVLT